MRGNSTASATASDNDTASRQQLREIEVRERDGERGDVGEGKRRGRKGMAGEKDNWREIIDG